MIRTQIIDGRGSSSGALVSEIGQQVVSPYSFDLSIYKELAADDTAYNFYGPKVNKQFVITGIVARADKQASSTVDADMIVYEATASDTATVSKVLFQMPFVQDMILVAIPLNILVNPGVYVNAKTADDDVHVNIMGYYIPELSVQPVS